MESWWVETPQRTSKETGEVVSRRSSNNTTDTSLPPASLAVVWCGLESEDIISAKTWRGGGLNEE